MLLQRRSCSVSIPCEHGIQDLGMLAIDIAILVRLLPNHLEHVTIALELLVGEHEEVPRPLGRSGGDQGEVKCTVPALPFVE